MPTDWNVPSAKVDGTHFTVGEVLANSGYKTMPRGPTRVGLIVCLTPRRNATKQAHAMEQLREMVNQSRKLHNLPPTGINLNSWARTWAHNQTVGGARFSQHLRFRACDVTAQEIARLMPWDGGAKLFDLLLNAVFVKGGVGLYPGGNRHGDTRGRRARWTSF